MLSLRMGTSSFKMRLLTLLYEKKLAVSKAEVHSTEKIAL
jgi:hypothetical protein